MKSSRVSPDFVIESLAQDTSAEVQKETTMIDLKSRS